ncbi:cysteine desulfurase family protein [Sphingorhabdus sp. 109]|jgi:cysteine desulfurase|uniref:cysteine desulfurase family protein n=1 Tax=Sphingorhabdus sp. 109 TaxID=2653173 RepID=UPI0012F2220B|nr:cysteine desulfurase family protein [Sphingorhabdus sp. 109]VWX56930.1 Cysteine desulfurase IscS [Sphingorhabdus sp. 109]
MNPVYLDNQATTPLAPEVFDAMLPWLKDNFGNPHSPHIMGRKAAAAVELARDQIAALCPPGGRVIFTGSATEAINLAMGAVRTQQGRTGIALVDTEHAAVRDTALWYGTQGFEPNLLPVDAQGLLRLEELEACLGPQTALVGAMLVNNEIGVIQPVDEIAAMAHRAGALMLCDAVQGFGRIDIPQQADMIALSGHKIYGPKGVGALWVREGIDIPAMIHGGGQEQGVRSGTLSPALCAGLGAAAKLCAERRELDMEHIVSLAERARSLFGDWTVNGSLDRRYAGNLNIRRAGLDVARLMSDVRGVAFSAGSACASGSGRPSHVLAALGLEPAQIKSSIRLGFGRYNDVEDVERAAGLINQAAEKQLS